MATIIKRSEWGARYRNGVGNRKTGSLRKFTHHTVTAHLDENATVAQEMAQVRILEQIGQQRFGAGMSYNYLIFPSGRIYEGVSPGRICYHSGSGRNTSGVGIAFVGNFQTNSLNTKAFNAAVWLLQWGVRQKLWGDPAFTEYHQQFRSTACPGRYVINRWADMNRAGRGKKVRVPKPTKTTKKQTGKVWPQQKLKVTGYHTTASHNAWVRMLAGIPGTDFTHRRLTRNIQRWLQWNGYYRGYNVDGQFGYWTTYELQRFLKDRGFYKGHLDGSRGPMTIKAEIRYINSQAKHYR